MAKPPNTPKSGEPDPAARPQDSDTQTAPPEVAPEIQLAWSKIISAAAQDVDFAQAAFGDLAQAFAQQGVSIDPSTDWDTALIPSIENAQQMVFGAANMRAQNQAIDPNQGASAMGSMHSLSPTTGQNDFSQNPNFTGEHTMQPTSPTPIAPLMGGCVGSFGTAGCVGSVGGTAGSAGTVGTYGCGGDDKVMAPTTFSQQTLTTQPCIPTQPCLTTRPTQLTARPTQLTTVKPTALTIHSQLTQFTDPPKSCFNSLLSQPTTIGSVRLSGKQIPMSGDGCWGSAGTIGSAGTFGGCAGTVGTGACYGSSGDDKVSVMTSSTPTTSTIASINTVKPTANTFNTVASLKTINTLNTINTLATLRPTLLSQLTTPVQSVIATEFTVPGPKPCIASAVSQPNPVAGGGCNGTFGTAGSLGSVGGTFGSAATVGSYGSAAMLEAANMPNMNHAVSLPNIPTAEIQSTRLSGATMGSFASYCDCMADQAQDPMSGGDGCWGSAGTIGTAGTFGGCAGTVGTGACYGSAAMLEAAQATRMDITPMQVNTLQMQPHIPDQARNAMEGAGTMGSLPATVPSGTCHSYGPPACYPACYQMPPQMAAASPRSA